VAPFLVQQTGSLLLIGRPGVGKTTLLRELASALSQNMALNVVVVDKTCEIAGDGLTPHSSIGSARWMPVGIPNRQAEVLREAVENQTPDVIICDEISSTGPFCCADR
jgi:stage III sporulation protein SpoIIIAA